jgi:cobyrinic acid a,c-diamide synthase
LPWRPDLALPERHLGLVTAREGRFPPGLFDALADLAERSIDLAACLDLATSRLGPEAPPAAAEPRARLGVALDEAFQFYYPDALEELRGAGAEVVGWSPLADARLPEVDGLYLGGGYPEVHAERLSRNVAMRRAVARFAGEGGLVYAECGGLMYLAESLEDVEGRRHPMAGVLPVTVRMTPPRLTLGYREVTVAAGGPLGPAGARLRGHEFHRSHLEAAPAEVETVYRVQDAGGGKPWRDGYRVGNTLASYVHVHFGSRPGTAEAFVAACGRRQVAR